MKLLVPEPPLQVLPSLAKEVGINEAIVLQQLHYWTQRSEPDSDGERWVYNTLPEWMEQFPWLAEATLRRILKRLRDEGMIAVRQPGGQNRTNHYRLIYEAIPDALTVIGPSDQVERFSNTQETTQERTSRSSSKSKDVTEVWNHYEALFPSPRGKGLTPSRTRVIEKALKEFHVEELKRALDGGKAWREQRPGGTEISDFLATNPRTGPLSERIGFFIECAEKLGGGKADDDFTVEQIRREQGLD